MILVLFLVIFFLFPNNSLASEKEQFVTVVNPVRISKYNKTPGESLKSQYKVVMENNVPATWLFTFDALENDEVLSVASSMNKSQEFGIFLEITKNFTEKIGIEYRDTGHWHHAGSVFLSGYVREERKLLIDKVFELFKEKFGYYPKSVGSWWTDSYSLDYMKEKYGIVSNLGCADQFSTDNYQLWGQPWMTPYYPNRFHTGVPAGSEENKLDVVNIQWASRDPLNGYYSSLYSTQDYYLAENPQGLDYFEKLINLYSNNFHQVTVGLESDLSPDTYNQNFKKQINLVRKKQDRGELKALTMKDFAKWYRENFPNLSPETNVESEDLLGSETKSYWYQSSKYRISYTKNENEIIIRDLRIYTEDIVGPYYYSPNRDKTLHINIPSIFDEIRNKEGVWKLPSDTEIITESEKIIIKGNNIKLPKIFNNYDSFVSVDKKKDVVEISFLKEMKIPKEGVEIKGYSSEAIHFFKQKKSIFLLLTGKGWNHFKKVKYLIPQEEMYALKFLSSLSNGKVLVYDKECLQCSYHTTNKPPVFSNIRSYVKKFSGHKIVKRQKVFDSESREESKEEFKKSRAKYIYLVRHEDYFEKIPFSPGDLGIEKIFSNANAEIWRVEEK